MTIEISTPQSRFEDWHGSNIKRLMQRLKEKQECEEVNSRCSVYIIVDIYRCTETINKLKKYEYPYINKDINNDDKIAFYDNKVDCVGCDKSFSNGVVIRDVDCDMFSEDRYLCKKCCNKIFKLLNKG